MASRLRTATFFAVCTLPGHAHAADFYVDTTADKHDVSPGDGVCAASFRTGPACTLRAAIEEANALAGMDRIHVPAGSYVLTLGELDVSTSMRIYGTGSPVIDADDKSRVFYVHAGERRTTVFMHSLTITNGQTWSGGGGLAAMGGVHLELHGCTVSNNQSLQMGSGIYNEGYLRLLRTSVKDNENTSGLDGGGVTARGGGIYNTATGELHVQRSSIVRNYSIRGGGIGNQGRVYLSDSTVSQNRALNYGGGIANHPIANGTSSIEIQRCTITQNEIDGSGSDAYIGGGGIANFDKVWMYTTIVAGNVDSHLHPSFPYAPDCARFENGSFSSSGHNLIGVTDGCGLQPEPSSIFGTEASPVEPGLGPLGAWTPGGTELHVLLPTSPALHAGPRCQLPNNPNTPIPNCYLTDQRGYARANGSPLEIDIGAYEGDGTPPIRALP